MKVHLYGITRMRDGEREWHRGSWGWVKDVAADDESREEAQETIDDNSRYEADYLDDDETSEWEGATVVEFTADIPEPMTEVDEIEETLRRR